MLIEHGIGMAEDALPNRPTAEGWYWVQWELGDEWKRVYLFEGGDTWGNHENDDPESVELDVNPELTKWKAVIL